MLFSDQYRPRATIVQTAASFHFNIIIINNNLKKTLTFSCTFILSTNFNSYTN